MESEPLVPLPMEKWADLQEKFKKDWPRSISGYNILRIMKDFEAKGLGYGFKVYCPYGSVEEGMVGINVKGAFFELVLHCPKDNTSMLEEALKTTKLVDWSTPKIVVPSAPPHIISMIKRVAQHLEKTFDVIAYTDMFLLDPEKPLYEVSLPPEVTFRELSLEHAELVDSKWPHRYPGSVWFFQLLIKAKAAFGLFENDQLAAWMFFGEAGLFVHLYTLEEYRRKGYAETIVKLMSNMLKRDKTDAFCFVVKGNEKSFKLFQKLGFSIPGEVAWCLVKTSADNGDS